MPAHPLRTGALRVLAAAAASLALAQGVSALSPAPQRSNSEIDAQLFYQVLIGEIELRTGDAGNAYQVMLDAARRTRDEALFRRATDIALGARAGDQALAAVQAWRQAVPSSIEAQRYLVQMLVALNRLPETVEPLRALIGLAPAGERAALIASLPRFFARTTDRAQAATLLDQALTPYVDAPETRSAARTAMGRAWLLVPDTGKALALAQRAHALDPGAIDPAGLALDLLPSSPAAEAIVTGHLAVRADSHAVRLGYVRVLSASQRYAEAVDQLGTLTRAAPQLSQPWLTLGALQLELRHPVEATAALKRYLSLVDTPEAPDTSAAPAEEVDTDETDDTTPQADANDEGRTQAWLLMSQAAEQQGDYAGAEGWLARVDNPQRALEVQQRRASMLARQGKVKEARELLRRAPEKTAADARGKLLAEAQLLREVKQWSEAYGVLAKANVAYPGDIDLLYEQSMVAEKLNRMDEMERLLRQVIQVKPDHHHAYNALGYSLAERNQRLPEAKALIQKALELSPGEPFITDSLGWVEYRLGNRDESLRLLRGAYQARPDPEIAAHLGEVLWQSGLRDEARKVWREGRSRDNANDVLKETLARLRVEL